MLQRGHFTIPNVLELPNIIPDERGISKVIELDYMGKYEFEGNAIPISRMFIEYNKDFYEFVPVDIYNKNGNQMFLYINTYLLLAKDSESIHKMAEKQINKNYSLYEYINHPEEASCDFWWDIQGDYFIFFGEEKKELVEYFINTCFTKDGGKESIKQKLHKAGYKLNDD